MWLYKTEGGHAGVLMVSVRILLLKILASLFPSNKEKCSQWLEVLQITENQLKPHWRVCSRHFPYSNPSKLPTVTLGKRFCSPMKFSVLLVPHHHLVSIAAAAQ